MEISFENLRKTYVTARGRVDALLDIGLKIRDGEFFVLLGPSGCGKSTLLNLTAGLERPSEGIIRFGKRVVAHPAERIFVPPRERDAAMVFQSYALYPHMDVFGNISFPLRIAGMAKGRIRRSVEETAEMLGIGPLLDRKPAELSGGQRQRVAIARALVRKPRVFLLDEPLSNLDAQLRTGTRGELKRLQREMGITTLYVTHDQTEAMTLGDRIALLNRGRLVQAGTPKDLYERPENPFAAQFVGSPPMNLLPAGIESPDREILVTCGNVRIQMPVRGRLSPDLLRERNVLMGIRPEHIRLSTEGGRGAIPGRIRIKEPLGREVLYHVETDQGLVVVSSSGEAFEADMMVYLSFDPGDIHLFSRREEPHKQAGQAPVR